jgi:catechol 2,3-dioxygenase-like lactoylglutathione lyase family enzyme
MGIVQLAHYSIRATDLAASEKFYTEVMGFRAGYRPPFNFPGRWLYRGGDEADYGIVHLIGDDPRDAASRESYLGVRSVATGTGVLDHIAFSAEGWSDMRARLRQLEVDYQERRVPALGLHQVFLQDPAGVTIELNYPAEEAGS